MGVKAKPPKKLTFLVVLEHSLLGLILSYSGCASSPKPLTYSEQVFQSLQYQTSAFRSCYWRVLYDEKTPADRAKMSGEVVVELLIDQDGRATKAFVKSSTLKQLRVESCILEEVLAGDYPQHPQREPATVTFPFTFRAN